MAALSQLETAYDALRHDPVFWADLRELLGTVRRPTDRPLPSRPPRGRDARGGTTACRRRRRGPVPQLRLYLKREDLAHTGAHKINNALGQALLTRRLGKTRVIAETGAGQHGVATATACALLDLPCVVYMGAEDIERQGPNVLRMRALGAEVRSVTSGTATLKDAVNEAMRDWVTNVETTHYVLGSAMGPHPVPDDRARPPAADRRRGGGPARRRGGPAAGPRARLRRRRLQRDRAAGPVHRRADGPPRGRRGRRRRHGDRPARRGDPRRDAGHPPRLPLADAPGPRRPGRRGALRLGRVSTTRASARSSPRSAEAGRIEVAAATDREAVAAMKATTRTEGILPALETAARDRGTAQGPGRGRRPGRRVPGRGPGPARLLRAVATRTSRP